MKEAKELQILKDNWEEFLRFMREQYQLYHLANVFARDIEYAVKDYLFAKGKKISFEKAEKISREFAKFLVEKGIFKVVKNDTGAVWTLNYPDFTKRAVEKVVEK